MVCLESDNTGQALLPHLDPLANKNAAVYPPHGAEFQIALVGDGADDQTHLVHMRGQQKPVSGGLGPLLKNQQVAQRVGVDAVGIGLRLGADIGPHRLLKAGHTGQLTQFLE